LTEEVGDVEASRLAERLTDLSEEHGSRNEGRIVKQLGDGVMLHFRRTDRAVEGVLDLVVAIPEAGLPSAHAGVAAGPVIERDGDYFGRTVNLASRLADVAEAGQVIVSEVVTRVPVGHVRFQPLGDVDVQGMGREPVFLAERDAPGSSATST
jgi:adenylate cyclase